MLDNPLTLNFIEEHISETDAFYAVLMKKWKWVTMDFHGIRHEKDAILSFGEQGSVIEAWLAIVGGGDGDSGANILLSSLRTCRDFFELMHMLGIKIENHSHG